MRNGWYAGDLASDFSSEPIILSDIEVVEIDSGLRLLATDVSEGWIYEGELNLANGSVGLRSKQQIKTGDLRIHTLEDGSTHNVLIAGGRYEDPQAASTGDSLQLGKLIDLSNSNLGVVGDVVRVPSSDTALFAVSTANSGSLGIYELAWNDTLRKVGSPVDIGERANAGVTALASIGTDQKSFVLAASASDNSIRSFEIDVAGNLLFVDRIGAQEGVGISSPTDIEVVSSFGKNYAVVASTGTSSLTVFELKSDGTFRLTDQINDNRYTFFDTPRSLFSSDVNGWQFFSVGGTENGLSQFVLLPDGTLANVANTPLGTYAEKRRFSEIDGVFANGVLHTLALDAYSDNLAHFQLDLSSLGPAVLSATGTEGNDLLAAASGDDLLVGNSGDDILFGGGGADTLSGGAGEDLFIVEADQQEDHILDFEKGEDEIDLSRWGRIYSIDQLSFETLADGIRLSWRGESLRITSAKFEPIAVKDLEAAGLFDVWRIPSEEQSGDNSTSSNIKPEARSLYGDGTSNALQGGDGNDTLDAGGGDDRLNGGKGADLMLGGAGNDSYVVDSWGDTIEELAHQGWDAITSTVSFQSKPNVELLRLVGDAKINGYGSVGSDVIIGNSQVNRIEGGSGDDTLDGSQGADTLVGGVGNDLYIVGDWADEILEKPGEGYDVVKAYSTYRQLPGVEHLILAGHGNFNAYGSYRADLITGNAGHNKVEGSGGNDTLEGGLGDDTIWGGSGNDLMRGGLDNDTYIVGSWGDLIEEDRNAGWDSAIAYASYKIPEYVERLTLEGSLAINGYGTSATDILVGNSAPNILEGYAGDDKLDGGEGNDTMRGGLGDDTYVVGSWSDIVSEHNGGGYDEVIAYSSYRVDKGIESLILRGSARLNAYGNDEANRINGNSAANLIEGAGGDDTLDGGGDADVLVGGAGNDIYIVGRSDDLTIEIAGNGHDIVKSYTNYELMENVEDLILVGSADSSGAGNDLPNQIMGNTGDNRISGGAGADTLSGGEGADTFIFNSSIESSAVDIITDFEFTQDRIEVGSFLIGGVQTGYLDPSGFSLGSTSVRASDRILYDSGTGELRVDPDGTGSAEAQVFAHIGPGVLIDHSAFIVV
ncbi:MAG: calcium-binding protein [Pseudomonadota bacterium]